MRPFAAGVGVWLAILAPAGAPCADYWTYQYKNIDVTAVAGGGYVESVAHNADRLGDALGRILGFKSDVRLPTHIYILADDDVKRLTGHVGDASFNTSGYDTNVVTSLGERENRYWGVWFGYVGSLLIGDGSLRFPYWFRTGVPEVFATTEFERERIRTGGISRGWAYTVSNHKWIPLRTFLTLHPDDPQLRDEQYAEMYAAESWYLTREIMVESRHRSEFAKYLELMHEGRSERDAFTHSFTVSYEELDGMLRDDMRAATHIYVISTPNDTSPEAAPPRKLTASEAQARLARVNLFLGHRAEALVLADAALHGEPGNESALRVVAAAQLKEGNYAGALATVDQLAGLGTLSSDAMAESADVLKSLGEAVSARRASLNVDSAALFRRARADYERALSRSEDLRSWGGLAELYALERDSEGARAFLPAASRALERHPRNANLAWALTRMCAAANQPEEALKFAAMWRENALSDWSRDQAAAYESRLRASMERRDVTAGGDSSPPAPRTQDR